MYVDKVQNPVVVQLNPGMQDRSLPRDLLGLSLLRRCRHLLVVRGRGEVMLVLMVLCDLEAAENDEEDNLSSTIKFTPTLIFPLNGNPTAFLRLFKIRG
jgi:hypothetical protein